MPFTLGWMAVEESKNLLKIYVTCWFVTILYSIPLGRKRQIFSWLGCRKYNTDWLSHSYPLDKSQREDPLPLLLFVVKCNNSINMTCKLRQSHFQTLQWDSPGAHQTHVSRAFTIPVLPISCSLKCGFCQHIQPLYILHIFQRLGLYVLHWKSVHCNFLTSWWMWFSGSIHGWWPPSACGL